jgi:hypothetical protein
MVKAIILLSAAAFIIWTRAFSSKWWWLEREVYSNRSSHNPNGGQSGSCC